MSLIGLHITASVVSRVRAESPGRPSWTRPAPRSSRALLASCGRDDVMLPHIFALEAYSDREFLEHSCLNSSKARPLVGTRGL